MRSFIFAFPLVPLLSLGACTSATDDASRTTGGSGAGTNPASGGTGTGGSPVESGGTSNSGGVGQDPTGGVSGGGAGNAPGTGGTAGSGGNGTGGSEPTACVPTGKAHNPLITHHHTADPNAIVSGDRVYIYASHDADGQTDYNMPDYHAYSSDDMVNWRDHGVVIDKADVPWLSWFYAPGACEKNDKYYLYMPNTGNNIGVAVADDPGGPFVDPLGEPLITKSYPGASVDWLFDPACFVDDDGQAYLYFGGGPNDEDEARVIRLNDDMISLMDASATSIRSTTDQIVPNFFEALHMHEHEGVYYLQYSADSSVGTTIQYGTGTGPMGPFEFHGDLLGNASINLNHNNHGSLIDFQGKSYQFYHNRKLRLDSGVGTDVTRSIAVQEIEYAQDGKLTPIAMTSDDYTVDQLKCLDGFQEVQAETIFEQAGIEVLGEAGETIRVGDIDTGDWVRYASVDFREGATQLVATVSASAGSSIDVKVDGCEDGTSIGTCPLGDTGGAFERVSCDITETRDGHDLCLVFSGSLEFDSWYLK